MSSRIRLDVAADGVAEVVLNRAEKMNALDAAMFEAIARCISDLGARTDVRAVVLRGDGQAFCAGLDMANFDLMSRPGSDASPLHAIGMPELSRRSHGVANLGQQAAWGWHTLPAPVIAAVHGVAFGGGLQVALGADIRYVRADARLSVMEIKWGLVPDMAGVELMSRLARPDVVRELTYSGRIFSGAQAVEMGLATRCCDDPAAEALALARQIAARSPDAIRAAKRLLNLAQETHAAAVLQAESDEQVRLLGTPNQTEAVRAALEKRAAKFAPTH